jgi:small-conductance mechanosensitive channel
VFSVTAQEVLGSCIFLFVKHPFDVGDRVDINSEQLAVERISLLYTVFKQVTTHKTTQVPNIVLNTVWIDNISRSKAMREQLQMYISFDTTLEDIQLLRNEMQNFVLDKENSRDFQPEIDVEVTGIASMDKMELKVEIRHKVRIVLKMRSILGLTIVVELVERSRKGSSSLQVHVRSSSCPSEDPHLLSRWWSSISRQRQPAYLFSGGQRC